MSATPSAGRTRLEAVGLRVFYENMRAVDDVSLRCAPDQIVGVFGGNGAGKSTLLSAISGLLLERQRLQRLRGGEEITIAGTVELDGHDLSGAAPAVRARRGLILVPERRRVFAESSVDENLAIGAHLVTRQAARQRRDAVFSIFPTLAARSVRRRRGGLLSAGEQQMLAIGRALMAQPVMLLLDEPLLGLTPLVQSALVVALRRIRDDLGVTMLIAEQYARPLLPVIDHGWVLSGGRVWLAGSGRELAAERGFQDEYFGFPTGSTGGALD